ALWAQDGELAHQQGPLRFDLKGLLWPWRRDPHLHSTLAASFQYEARSSPFDGPNQLGGLTDLMSVRVVLNKPVGLSELGLVAGALWEPLGRYGTAELGARAALHLPMADLKVFAEGLIRGVPAIVRSGDPLPGLDPMAPIKPHGVLAVGLISRT